jgi:hypothetical protein
MIRGLILVLALTMTTSAHGTESRYLKGVTAMTYIGFIEPNKPPCEIDWRAWNTSIDFVANQSTKLKFMSEHDHYQQVMSIYDRIKVPDFNNAEAIRKWNEELEEANKFSWMPKLEFSITPIDGAGTCVAMIEVSVEARLKQSAMIATGVMVGDHNMRIWSSAKSIRSPVQTFSSFAIQVSEEMFKEFVNDWAASQKWP